MTKKVESCRVHAVRHGNTVRLALFVCRVKCRLGEAHNLARKINSNITNWTIFSSRSLKLLDRLLNWFVIFSFVQNKLHFSSSVKLASISDANRLHASKLLALCTQSMRGPCPVVQLSEHNTLVILLLSCIYLKTGDIGGTGLFCQPPVARNPSGYIL